MRGSGVVISSVARRKSLKLDLGRFESPNLDRKAVGEILMNESRAWGKGIDMIGCKREHGSATSLSGLLAR